MLHKNYIILAHKNPEQLKRLIDQLNDELSTFYIHIDKKTEITHFTHLIPVAENIIFIKNRFNVIWCDHSTVEATLAILKEALKIKRKGYCILISGQDFPIKSNAHINSFLNKNSNYDFIDIHAIPTRQWYQNGLNRIHHYKFNLSAKRGHFVVCPSLYEKTFYTFQNLKSIGKLFLNLKISLLLKLFFPRKRPKHIIPYGGSQWWCLKNETVEKIVTFCDEQEDFRKYHKYTLLSDEIFFQSVIMHIKDHFNLQLKNSLTFVDWDRDVPIKPPTFSVSDKELLLNQPDNKLFARKFDQDYDNQIMTFLSSFLNTNS